MSITRHRSLFLLVLPVLTLFFASGCQSSDPPAETPEILPTASLIIPSDPTPSAVPPVQTATALPPPTLPPMDPQPGAEGIGDPYFPSMGNGGYDVEKYTLELVVNPIGREIEATATLQMLALQDILSFNLDYDGPPIKSVTVNSVKANYARNGSELIIIPADPIPVGYEFETIVTYSGDPSGDTAGGVTTRESSWVWYTEGSFVAGEPSGASGWYPVNEHPSDKALYDLLITVPDPFSVAANGELKESVNVNGINTFHFVLDDPVAPYLVTVNIAPFDTASSVTENGIAIRNYFEEGVPNSTRNAFDIQGEMLDFFSGIFGPYPFDAYGVVVVDLSLGFALETQTLSFFGSGFVNETVIAHELAHQWYGDSVSLYRWEDIWLNEGFATYASLLWSEHAYGVSTLEREIGRMYANMAPGIPIYNVSRTELVDGLKGLPYEGTEITREQAIEALTALLGNNLEPEAIATAAESYPDTFDRALILDLMDDLPFDNAAVTGAHVDAFLMIIGLEEYTNGAIKNPPTANPGPEKIFSGTVYQRGALVLHALRLEVGDEDFWQILQTYAARFAYGNATTADFIAVAEEVSGKDLGEFFDAWLDQLPLPDMPELGLFREDYLP